MYPTPGSNRSNWAWTADFSYELAEGSRFYSIQQFSASASGLLYMNAYVLTCGHFIFLISLYIIIMLWYDICYSNNYIYICLHIHNHWYLVILNYCRWELPSPPEVSEDPTRCLDGTNGTCPRSKSHFKYIYIYGWWFRWNMFDFSIYWEE